MWFHAQLAQKILNGIYYICTSTYRKKGPSYFFKETKGVPRADVQTYHVIGLNTRTPAFSMSVKVAMVTVFDLIL